MKKLLLSILTLVFILSTCGLYSVRAEENETHKESECTLHLDGPKKEPRMPAKISIHCLYRNGILQFSFPEEIEYITATVEHAESHSSWTSLLGKEDSMFISTANGTYNISAETESGQHFSGILYVME